MHLKVHLVNIVSSICDSNTVLGAIGRLCSIMHRLLFDCSGYLVVIDMADGALPTFKATPESLRVVYIVARQTRTQETVGEMVSCNLAILTIGCGRGSIPRRFTFFFPTRVAPGSSSPFDS